MALGSVYVLKCFLSVVITLISKQLPNMPAVTVI